MPPKQKFTDQELIDACKVSMTVKEASDILGVFPPALYNRAYKMRKDVKLKNGKIINMRKDAE